MGQRTHNALGQDSSHGCDSRGEEGGGGDRERTKVEYNEACDKRCVPIKTYSPSNEEGGGRGGGITAIYKWTVKLNSPRLGCRDDAVGA